MSKNITLGISGASGMPIAFTLLKELLQANCIVHLVMTNSAVVTVKQEMDLSLSANPNLSKGILLKSLSVESFADNLHVYTNNDWYAPIASGSSVSDAMVICPCSMATLGRIAAGIGEDLLARAADVVLKERKNLVLVPRETPLSAIHLSNMLDLARLGVSILPPVPAFYTHPQTIMDVVNSIVNRIMDQLGVKCDLVRRW